MWYTIVDKEICNYKWNGNKNDWKNWVVEGTNHWYKHALYKLYAFYNDFILSGTSNQICCLFWRNVCVDYFLSFVSFLLCFFLYWSWRYWCYSVAKLFSKISFLWTFYVFLQFSINLYNGQSKPDIFLDWTTYCCFAWCDLLFLVLFSPIVLILFFLYVFWSK